MALTSTNIERGSMDVATEQETCIRCRSMTSTLEGLQALVSKQGYRHYNFPELRVSAYRGCPLCSHLLHNFTSWVTSWKGNPDSFSTESFYYLISREDEHCNHESPTTMHPFQDPAGNVRVNRLSVKTEKLGTIHGADVYLYTISGDAASKYLPVLPLHIPVSGDRITKQATAMLEWCQKNHFICRPITSELPARILSVRPDALLHLHTSSPHEQAPYIALSYCWGGPQAITTNLHNLAAHQQYIDISTLPQTIVDAIAVTRSLEIHYLWIDALCIIQDSADDKATEITKMSNVYKGATLTIAAAAVASATAGFLADRTVVNVCEMAIYLTPESSGRVWLRSIGQNLSLESVEPLDTRAWTFQEDALSRRVLYYGNQDVLWKCQKQGYMALSWTHDWSLSLEQKEYTAGQLDERVFCKSPKVQLPDGKTLEVNARVQNGDWRRLIRNYAERELTLSEDRLPALAGIVAELKSIWRDEYVAGLWRRCLIRQLGWRWSKTRDTIQAAHYASGCPSWSWASQPVGKIDWNLMEDREEAEFIMYEVTPANDKAPLGQVKAAILVLKACILTPQRDYWNDWAIYMDVGPSGSWAVDEDSKLLLLGYDISPEDQGSRTAVALIIQPAGDGTYIRAGCAERSWTEGCLPDTEDYKKVLVTLV